MPVITYEGAKLTSEQKKHLIEKFTEISVEITSIPKNFFSVLIRELDDDNLGSNGEQVSEIKKRMAASKA